jgi:type VI secretion system secreted protein Hcp
MATIAYLTIVGARQGPIKGDVTAAGRAGTIAATALASEVNAPFDVASGAVTGRRQHRPITITTLVDQATPKLYAALVANETLTDVTIAFWRSASAGAADKQYFTIKLTNAHIAGIRLAAPEPGGPPAATDGFVEVQFVYQKISWTWVDGGITAEDNWATQTV